jgi:hypothetical protein
MIHSHDVMRKRLLERAGIVDELQQPLRSLEWIYETQWDSKFEEFMRNRLAMGYFRYGSLHSPARKKKKYDHVGSAIKRLKLYLETGNQEHLVDVANLCMVEFMLPTSHTSPSFRAVDDGLHTEHIGVR